MDDELELGSWKWLPDGKPLKAVGEFKGKKYTVCLPRDELDLQRRHRIFSDLIKQLVHDFHFGMALVSAARAGHPQRLHKYVSDRLGGSGEVHDFVMTALVARGKQTRGARTSILAAERSRKRAKMFLAELTRQKNKTAAYEIVGDKFGVDERTIRNDVREYELHLELRDKIDELEATMTCLFCYALHVGWSLPPSYRLSSDPAHYEEFASG